MFEISDFFDVSALSTVLEERLMSIHDVQLAINALRIVKPLDVCHQERTHACLGYLSAMT